MKPSFSLLILLLLFLAGCTCLLAPPTISPQPSIVSAEYGEELAKQFCPLIYLCSEGEIVENFEPEQIEIMLDTAVLHDVEDPSFSEMVTLSNLLRWSKNIYYLDIAELEPKTNSVAEYKLTYDKAKARYQPSVYARVKEGGGESYTVIQYWIFYYFNDWRNCHEGDWELVQLCFPGCTAQELLEKVEQPFFAAYSQHQAGQRMSWSDMKDNALVLDTHPVVYVAQGSHANYFAPGRFWSGLDFDNTGLSSWKVLKPEQLNLVLLPEIGTASEEPGWLEFKGRWGENLDSCISVLGLKFWQRGPFGPPWGEGGQTNTKWEHPDEWASELPEYPDPFWTSFFKLAGDWFNRAFFCLFSPANIHVYDSQGHHVGLDENGELENQIPGAVYIAPQGTQYKTIVIPSADISYGYKLVMKGTGLGIMDIKIQVPDTKNNARHYLEYASVPVSATTVARVDIVPDGVIRLELDSDGDGVFELESTPGKFEGKKVTPPVIEANPARLSLEPVRAESEIDTPHEIVATVYDSESKPMTDIKVNFIVKGANSISGEATTDNNGQAILTYYGKNPGEDNITAKIDSLVATATMMWTSESAASTPARLIIYPVQAKNPVGAEHTITFTVYDTEGKPMPGVRIYINHAGANPFAPIQLVTDANGKANYSYIGKNAGIDTISARVDNLVAKATKEWYAPQKPSRISLEPARSTNKIGELHTVVATILDTNGKPLPRVTVYFKVSGTITKSSRITTGADGKASFSYSSKEVGKDTIVATCDNLRATATKEWIIPPPSIKR